MLMSVPRLAVNAMASRSVGRSVPDRDEMPKTARRSVVTATGQKNGEHTNPDRAETTMNAVRVHHETSNENDNRSQSRGVSLSRNGHVHREGTMIRSNEDADSEIVIGTEDEPSAEHRLVIAIDGPAAAGKTTVAKALAARLGATYLDTGLLYRAVTLLADRAGLPMTDGLAIAELARKAHFVFESSASGDQSQYLVLDGENVTPLLRTPKIDRLVSEVSRHPEVRAAMLPIQRQIAAYNKVVMVGRDITTVVVPDAGVKIFLDASPEERARRRLEERREQGLSGDFNGMLGEIRERDHLDSTREFAPLRAAEGVEIVQTDGMSKGDVIDAISEIAARAWNHIPEDGAR